MLEFLNFRINLFSEIVLNLCQSEIFGSNWSKTHSQKLLKTDLKQMSLFKWLITLYCYYLAAPNFWPSAMPAVMTLYCYYIAAPNFGPSAMPAVYLQNKRCFEIVHFYDKINLILNPAGRIFMTQMTLMCTVVFIRIRYYCVEFTPSGNRYGYKTVYIRVSKVVVHHKKLLTQWRYI